MSPPRIHEHISCIGCVPCTARERAIRTGGEGEREEDMEEKAGREGGGARRGEHRGPNKVPLEQCGHLLSHIRLNLKRV